MVSWSFGGETPIHPESVVSWSSRRRKTPQKPGVRSHPISSSHQPPHQSEQKFCESRICQAAAGRLHGGRVHQGGVAVPQHQTKAFGGDFGNPAPLPPQNKKINGCCVSSICFFAPWKKREHVFSIEIDKQMKLSSFLSWLPFDQLPKQLPNDSSPVWVSFCPLKISFLCSPWFLFAGVPTSVWSL